MRLPVAPQRSEPKTHMASTADACRRVAQACERRDVAGAVQIMREHAGSAAVQQAACVALIPVTGSGDTGFCARAVAAGALDAVLAALATHTENVVLQATCCALVTNLARVLGGLPSVAAARAAGAVVAALRAHPSVSMVQTSAFAALGSLALSGTAEVFAAAVAAGAIEAAVGALVTHESDAAVQADACRLLVNLGACAPLLSCRAVNTPRALPAHAPPPQPTRITQTRSEHLLPAQCRQ
jgi:hypothetical protein